MSAQGKAVLMIIASQQFRDEELAEPRAVLEAAGVVVTIACSSLGVAVGMLGKVRQAPDKTLDSVDPNAYDGVIFVGGTGAKQYWDHPRAHRIAQEAVRLGKVVAAICIAPVILARAGLLKGRNVAVFPTVSAEIETAGGRVTGRDVEVDGRIITASGPKAATAFGKAVLKALGG